METTDDERLVVLPAAPTLPEDDPGQNALTSLLPLTGVLGSVAMVLGAGPAGGGGRGLLMAGALVLSALAMVLAQVWRQRVQRRRTTERARVQHLHHLARLADELETSHAAHREAVARRLPAPTSRATPAPAESEGLTLRLGTASVPSDIRFEVEASGAGVVDPVCREALALLPRAHARVREVPTAVDLKRWSHLVLTGDEASWAGTVRALLLNAARHPEERVALAVLCGPDEHLAWDWLKWLPHAGGAREDAAGPVRLVDHRRDHLLARVPRGRHLVLVVTPRAARLEQDQQDVTSPSAQATVITDRPPRHGEEARSVLTVPTDGSGDPTPALPGVLGVRTDRCSPTEAAFRARSRAGAATVGGSAEAPTVLTPDTRPGPRSGADLMRVPIGVTAHDRGAATGTPTGSPAGTPDVVHLDLKEAAQGGHGPHGLVVGATGSGKSELLRSLVVGLVATHVPDDLALVLVDFKGGATFADVADLPHVAACVTNLADDTTAVDRMQDALTGEMERRQELLHVHGHPSVTAHRAAREHDPSLPAMPHLFVCVDEFSELLAARPDFVHLFTAIGRLGRSLGIHLLLASQRLDEGRLHALEAHLSYRVALRTFSASESRAAIGVPDAHTLPRRPGTALLRTGADALVRFDALHVGSPVEDTAPPAADAGVRVAIFTVLPTRTTPSGRRTPEALPPLQQHGAPTLADVLVEGCRTTTAHLPATHRIWLPPLDAPIPLGTLVRRHGHLAARPGALTLVIGEVDRPRLQRREPLTLDLAGAGGHVAVVGAPRSGRSTTLQTIVTALGLRMTPVQAVVHLVDLAGGALAPLADLPHVVSHVTRERPDLLQRVVTEAEEVVAARERGTTGGAPQPRVFLVLDGWGTLRAEHDELEHRLTALAPRALAVGVHLVVSALRWGELRPAFAEVVASRVELRLGDAFDSVVDRRAAAGVPMDVPGRGIAPGGYAMRVAWPSLHPSATTGEGSVKAAVDAIAGAWTGPTPARMRDLPVRVHRSDLAPPADGTVRLGLDEAGATVRLPTNGHLVVRSADGAGRTTALRDHVREWVLAVPEGQVLLLDPRGSLRDLVDDAHLLGHAATAEESGELVRALADALTRPPGTAGTRRPPVTVVVDDLDLLRDTGADLSALLPLLPRAEEWGVRVVLGTRGVGPTRMRDRLTGLVEDLGATTLDLSGEVPGRAVLGRRGSTPATLQLTAPTDLSDGLSDGRSGTSLGRSPVRRSA